MSDSDKSQRSPIAKKAISGVRQELNELSGWRKLLFKVAVFVLVAGLGMQAYSKYKGSKDGGSSSGTSSAPVGASSLDGGSGYGAASSGSGSSTTSDPDGMSPAMTKLGFGFVAGMSIGTLLRKFLKVTASFLGLFLLGMMGLDQLGVLNLDWEFLQGGASNLWSTISGQFESLEKFVLGKLPATGSSAVGFYSGLRKGRV